MLGHLEQQKNLIKAINLKLISETEWRLMCLLISVHEVFLSHWYEVVSIHVAHHIERVVHLSVQRIVLTLRVIVSLIIIVHVIVHSISSKVLISSVVHMGVLANTKYSILVFLWNFGLWEFQT